MKFFEKKSIARSIAFASQCKENVKSTLQTIGFSYAEQKSYIARKKKTSLSTDAQSKTRILNLDREDLTVKVFRKQIKTSFRYTGLILLHVFMRKKYYIKPKTCSHEGRRLKSNSPQLASYIFMLLHKRRNTIFVNKYH